MQRSGEQTRSRMCRLQQLASIAFPELKDEDRRERAGSIKTRAERAQYPSKRGIAAIRVRRVK